MLTKVKKRKKESHFITRNKKMAAATGLFGTEALSCYAFKHFIEIMRYDISRK